MMPVPRVWLMNSARKPRRPRAGTRNSRRTLSPRRHHVLHLALAAAQVLHDHADVLLGHVDDDVLDRLHELVVDALEDDLGARDLELEAFAAHRLDQDAEVQLAAARDLEDVGAVRRLDAQGDVGADLARQALADVAGGDVGAFLAGEG